MPQKGNLLADILSVITITTCFVLKVPQILRLMQTQQVSGMSCKALFLELSSYTITMLYNYTNQHAILSYMEYPIIVIQEFIIIFLVFQYKNYRRINFWAIIVIHSTISLLFAYNIFDKFLLTLLLPFTTPVGALSKILQLMEIVRNKNADSVSVLTWFLSAFTNVTRIYTVFVDSSDIALLCNFSLSSILSTSVMLTAIYFQKFFGRAEKKEN